MSLKEHDKNQYTKESTEVEKYLMRIIQRYFDIENNYTKESIEAIIIESLTRFKQMIVSEKGFIFSFNQQTGHITLTIKDFGGEECIDKKTAFNKHFGSIEDTVCEGNDPRLTDDRKPIQHIHPILEVEGLKQLLENLDVLNNVHFHNNMSVLDSLKYAGSRTEIDLILLEQIERTVNNYCDTFEKHKPVIKSIHDNIVDDIVINKTVILTELKHMKELVGETRKWIDKLTDSIDEDIRKIKVDFDRVYPLYVTKDTMQTLLDYANKAYFLVKDGEIDISNGNITITPEVLQDNPNGLYGVTYIEEVTNVAIDVTGVNNFRASLYLRYEDKDGNTHNVQLPYYNQDGREDHIIEVKFDENTVYIMSRLISFLAYYIEENYFYDENTLLIPTRDRNYTYSPGASDAKVYDCTIALIDSEEKNNFVKNLLVNGVEYYIQGYNFSLDGTDFVDDEGNVLTYTDWDTGEPNFVGLSSHIKYNTNKKWARADGVSEWCEYIIECKIKRLSNMYKNPRIYYQIFGNKEG